MNHSKSWLIFLKAHLQNSFWLDSYNVTITFYISDLNPIIWKLNVAPSFKIKSSFPGAGREHFTQIHIFTCFYQKNCKVFSYLLYFM